MLKNSNAFSSIYNFDEVTRQYSWVKDPLEVWNLIGGKLSMIILDEKSETPNDLEKNNNLWSNLFKEVYIYGYMSKI